MSKLYTAFNTGRICSTLVWVENDDCLNSDFLSSRPVPSRRVPSRPGFLDSVLVLRVILSSVHPKLSSFRIGGFKLSLKFFFDLY